MAIEDDSEKLKQAISRHTGKKPEEIEAMVNAKKQKFAGLLTEAGAAYMIAKELGASVEQQEKLLKISELRSGMPSVSIAAAIKQVFQPKEFERNGRKGRLQNIVLADSTGEVRATLWNDEIEKFALAGLAVGRIMKFSDCSVSQYNGQLQLGVNHDGTVTASEAKITLPGPEKKIIALNDLDEGMNDVCVKARIAKIFPAKEFENERGKGRVMNFVIAEGMQEMRATAWNEACDSVQKFDEGDEVRIEGAYTRKNRGETELHLGRNAMVVRTGNDASAGL